MQRKIAIIGTGYVGLTTGACLAYLGHKVICVDRDEEKIERLQKGSISIYEPGLEDLVKKNIREKRLFFSTDLGKSIQDASIVFICVGTPSAKDGKADLSYVRAVAQEIGKNIKKPKIIVTKSTVPVGTGKNLVSKIISKYWQGNFEVASNPEFLREGTAISDFLNPDRIVIGVNSRKAARALLELYEKINCPKIITTLESAEMIKYASNAFLATKISFINEIANLCEKAGADVEEVAKGVGSDKRIGKHFLKAGIGYGGSCLPKDVRALRQLAGANGYRFRLLESAIGINSYQKKQIVDKIKDLFPGKGINPVRDLKNKARDNALKNKISNGVNNRTIAVLGLAFKGNTDDIRDSAAIMIIKKLQKLGAEIKAYDPKAIKNARRILDSRVKFCGSPYEAVEKADLAIVATEWENFKELNWKKIKNLLKEPIIVDGRNLLDPIKMKKLGFRYIGVGRNI